MSTLYIMSCSSGRPAARLSRTRLWTQGFAQGDELAYLSARHGFLSWTVAVSAWEPALTAPLARSLAADTHQRAALAALVEGHGRVVVQGGPLYAGLVAALVGPQVAVTALEGHA